MRTDTAQPIRLKDYRPPDWLVETVDLEFSLHPTQTRVRASLLIKPNPDGAAAPLILDGDGLTVASLKLDGAPLPADSFAATPDRLTIPQRRSAPSGSTSKPWSIRPRIRNCPAFTAPAVITARSAKPRASAASHISRTGPT